MSVRKINADLTVQNSFKELDNRATQLQKLTNSLNTGHSGTTTVNPSDSLEIVTKNGVIQSIKVVKGS